jgi:hypothetical protein
VCLSLDASTEAVGIVHASHDCWQGDHVAFGMTGFRRLPATPVYAAVAVEQAALLSCNKGSTAPELNQMPARSRTRDPLCEMHSSTAGLWMFWGRLAKAASLAVYQLPGCWVITSARWVDVSRCEPRPNQALWSTLSSGHCLHDVTDDSLVISALQVQ